MWEYNYDYLEHHGILGQKWGVRRFQNADGSLTAAGKNRYKTSSIKGNIGRAIFYTPVGERLLGVGLNKGYREDRKEIKALYKKEKEKIENKNISKESKKERLAKLKDDYHKTKGEARVTAAEILYPWQSTEHNKKNQTSNLGKEFVKSLLLTGYGDKIYNQLITEHNVNKGIAVVGGYLGSVGNLLSYGGVGLGDYILNRYKAYDKK